MSAIIFDTAKAQHHLEKAGMPRDQAGAVVEVVTQCTESIYGKLVTKADLELLRADIELLRAATKTDIELLRADMRLFRSELGSMPKLLIGSISAIVAAGLTIFGLIQRFV